MEWFIAAVLAILSIVLLTGKGAFLIAGYNTANKKEKAKYDEKKLCRVVGGGLGIITVLLVLMAVFQDDPPSWFGVVFSAGFFLAFVLILVLSNTICRVKPAPDRPAPPEKKRKQRVLFGINIAVIGIFCGVVGGLLFTGDIRITVTESQVVADGSYWSGYEVELDSIEEVSLEKNLDLGRRVGGLGSMRLLEGNFRNEAFGKYTLYAYVTCKSYVVLRTPGRTVVLNQETAEATEELYQAVKKAVG